MHVFTWCFSLFILYFYFLTWAEGVCGLLLNGIFFLGGGSCLGNSLTKAKTGNSFGGGVYSNLMFWGMFDTYILRKGCGAK